MSTKENRTYKINEIFTSIDGEGVFAGLPAVFVRFQGCNLKCSYCDTSYAADNTSFVGVQDHQELINNIMLASRENTLSPGIRHITITGGEPLIQPEINQLIFELMDRGYIVNIETNGSISANGLFGHWRAERQLVITMDYKCSSSGMLSHMDLMNLRELRTTDVVKFVVGDYNDFQNAYDVLRQNLIRAQVFFSPVFGKIEPVTIVNWILNHQLYNARIQLQMHKQIWDPEAQGV